MSELLKEKANEVSLMLVMTAEGDDVGLKMLLDLCMELGALAKNEKEFEVIYNSAEYLKAKELSSEIYKLIQDFSECSNKFLDGLKDVKFPGVSNKNSDIHTEDAEIDERFLAEFIENHASLLEEFESKILDSTRNSEFESYIKGYLHNLKGDAGSIGLNDIEIVCHKLEDLLACKSLAEVEPVLLIFKQWVLQCFSLYRLGTIKNGLSQDFLSGLNLLEPFSEKQTTQAPLLDIKNGSDKSSNHVSSDNSGEYKLTGESEILVEFAIEAEEHLNSVESIILEAEDSYDKESIDKMFRGVHSIKGGSAYFNLEEMTKCSHILENILSEVRDGKRQVDTRLSALLLIYIDLQKDVLKRAKNEGVKTGRMIRSEKSLEFLQKLNAYSEGMKDVEMTSAVIRPSKEVSSSAESAKGSVSELPIKPDTLNIRNFVKVDTARLDVLIDSIGEMVIYSSMLIRHCRDLLSDNESVMDATHRVEKFSRDLQDIGMSMRLDPIKGLFQKMSRLVWDTSKKLGKEVLFSMEGEDTELDRNLIDKLADPLMHMVRNSLDHGIEPPEERERKGKNRAGQVKLSAYHSGGNIHISIKDDGRGLDTEKLLAKAKERGIVQEGQKLTESEIFQLIFAAGFSTAAVVTDISGRGVGMDVVRRNVESLRGRIHIDSKLGQGSTFTIELPLTLAIIDGIQLQVGTESFLLPSLSVLEFIKPKSNQISSPVDKGETFYFRGQYIPIYRIAELYGLIPNYSKPEDSTLVIVESNNEQVALMVDEILGECSTVIKSLGDMFSEGKGLAGCAIMPKGNVALILDVRSLIKLARSEYYAKPKLENNQPVVQ